MKSWVKSVFVVSCAVVLTVSSGLTVVARPGDGDTQLQVQIDELTAKIKANPRDFDAILQRGMLYRKLHKLDLCESDGKLLVALYPSRPSGYWLLSRVAKDQKNYSNGLKWIKECISREKPELDHFHYELDCLIGLKQYKNVISRSFEIEKLFPNDGETLYYRAIGRYNTNENEKLVKKDLLNARRYAAGNTHLLEGIDNLLKLL